MDAKTIKPETAVFIVIDLDGCSSFLPKNDLNNWIKDGSIQPGFTVLAATIHNVFQAKTTVELISTQFKDDAK